MPEVRVNDESPRSQDGIGAICEALIECVGADYGTRTRNPRITSTVRYQLRQVGGCHQLSDGIDPASTYGAGVVVGVGVGVSVARDASLATLSTNCENSAGSSGAPT